MVKVTRPPALKEGQPAHERTGVLGVENTRSSPTFKLPDPEQVTEASKPAPPFINAYLIGGLEGIRYHAGSAWHSTGFIQGEPLISINSLPHCGNLKTFILSHTFTSYHSLFKGLISITNRKFILKSN